MQFDQRGITLNFVRFCLVIGLTWGFFLSNVAMAEEVIAVVDGQKIMKSELDEFTEKLPAPFREAFRQKALQQVIESKVFYGLGRKAGLLDSEEYRRKIDRASRMILADMFIEEKLKPAINVTDEEAKAYYQENQTRFNSGKKIEVGHILFKSEDTAVNVRKKITSDNFDDSVAGLSQMTDDARYFMIGWTEKGQTRMPQSFEDVAFSLEKGEVSPVVKSQVGYHIIKVFDVKPGQKASFSQVRETIIKSLAQKRLNDLKQQYLKKAEIEILAKEYQ
jgi:peptidyl-prolyl cis-trans isomerase C